MAETQPNSNSNFPDLGNMAEAIGSTLSGTPAVAGQCIGDWVASATQLVEEATNQVQQYLEKATQTTGSMAAAIANLPFVKFITKTFGKEWLQVLLGAVDIEQAEKTVRQLQQQYPQETPSQIAHRLMVQKSIQAAGIGLVTNIIPPIAAALFAIDLATTTRLQAEMVYQIAAAYGLDLQDPTRRGEVLALFGLALSGSIALETGLGFVEILPGVGPMVGASSNAILLYTLGYAASRFYEVKLQSKTQDLTVAEFQQQNQDYLKSIQDQQRIMDQILAHMILASYPDKAWSDIIPEMKQAHLTPESVQAIAEHLQKPQSLDGLLNQLDPDFATPVLAQCYRISQINGQTTPEEQRILNAIANKFKINLSQFGKEGTGNRE